MSTRTTKFGAHVVEKVGDRWAVIGAGLFDGNILIYQGELVSSNADDVEAQDFLNGVTSPTSTVNRSNGYAVLRFFNNQAYLIPKIFPSVYEAATYRDSVLRSCRVIADAGLPGSEDLAGSWYVITRVF